MRPGRAVVKGGMVRQLIIDLDDTLVDTFDLLIRPLETGAAELLRERGLVDREPSELVERLLEIRRRSPESFYDELARVAGAQASAAVDLHRSIFSDFAVDSLILSPEVTRMLSGLRSGNRLVLMTEGRTELQRSKIEHLRLPELFDEVLIVDPARGETKRGRLADYMRHADASPEDMIVIGNRLDREIAAANAIGARSIWLRKGEGSEAAPRAADEMPDAIILDLLELPQALESLRA